MTENFLKESETSDTTVSTIVSDSNVPLLDDVLVELDLLWRFRASRGLPYTTELAEFERERDLNFGLDRGGSSIPVGRQRSLNERLVPEGSWYRNLNND